MSTLRILCVHGYQQNVDIFENQLSKLRKHVADVATLSFVEAPFAINQQEGEEVVLRSWSSPEHARAVNEDSLELTEDSSATQDELYAEGDRVLEEAIRAGSYDVLLGFSQGALMVCRFLMRCVVVLHSDPAAPALPRGVILAGCPDPRRVFSDSSLLEAYRDACYGGSGAWEGGFLGAVQSLHIIGSQDAFVSPDESITFAADCDPISEMIVHDHAHSIPELRHILDSIHNFLERVTVDGDGAAWMHYNEAQEQEIEMIRSMYGEECVRRRGSLHTLTLPLFAADEMASVVSPELKEALERLQLHVVLPAPYPHVLPEMEILRGPASHNVAYERWRSQAVMRTMDYLRESIGLGEAMLIPGLLFANQDATEHLEILHDALDPVKATDRAGSSEEEEDEWMAETEEQRMDAILAAEVEAVSLANQRRTSDPTAATAGVAAPHDSSAPPQLSGGSWKLTIGLIGKPSAGKSTFFNAITDPSNEEDQARVAAFPFTTIEPNVGMGYGPVRCPCACLTTSSSSSSANDDAIRADFASCDAEYGHAVVHGDGHYRRHPVRVKDVAGLVQGAYQGKGKGNAFLNDLCDADVLVHVVDGAASTDADGSACPLGQGSTVDDIRWVRAEVHSWIYDNLKSKWSTIVRQPPKLRTMFTGYRSSPAFVDGVLRQLDIHNDTDLKLKIRCWKPVDLHRLVALYIYRRFPLVVALNKSDLPTAADVAAQLRSTYPDECFMPMSAQVETDALTLRKKGLVSYNSGEHAVVWSSRPSEGPTTTSNKEDASRIQRVKDFFGHHAGASTGVQEVLAEAIRRCGAVFVFPVAVWRPAISSLKHGFAFKQGATVEDVFWTMTYAKLLDGKLVRCEVIDLGDSSSHDHAVSSLPALHQVMNLKRLDVLPAHCVLARVLATKRQLQ